MGLHTRVNPLRKMLDIVLTEPGNVTL